MAIKLGHTANLNGISSTEQRSLWCREHWLANTDSERWCQLQQATTKVTAAKHSIHGWMNEDLLVHVRATDKIKPILEFQQLSAQLKELTSTNLVMVRQTWQCDRQFVTQWWLHFWAIFNFWACWYKIHFTYKFGLFLQRQLDFRVWPQRQK